MNPSSRLLRACRLGNTGPLAASLRAALAAGLASVAILATPALAADPAPPAAPQAAVEAASTVDPAKDTMTFFTIDAGSGHTKIEAALKDGIMKSPIATNMNVVEKSILFNEHLTPYGQWFWKTQYITMAKYAPPLWEFSYTVVPAVTPTSVRRWSYEKFITPELVAALTKDNPKIIVCTQPVLADIVDILKVQGKIPASVKVVNLVTDYSVTKAYNTRGLIIVPDEELKAKLVKMGKDPKMIQVVQGIPAGPKFLEPFDKSVARKSLDAKLSEELGKPGVLGTDEPFFVASGGGEGLNLKEVIDFLPNWHPTRPVKVAVVCGNNKELLERVTKMIAEGKIDSKITVIPRGYVNMFEYSQAADVIISKPGGSMTAEQIALGDGMFVHAYVPGQERHNFTTLSKKGVIEPLKLKDLNDIDAIMARRDAMKAAIAAKYPDVKNLPANVAKVIQDYADGKIPESAKEARELEEAIAKSQMPGLRSATADCAQSAMEMFQKVFAKFSH